MLFNPRLYVFTKKDGKMSFEEMPSESNCFVMRVVWQKKTGMNGKFNTFISELGGVVEHNDLVGHRERGKKVVRDFTIMARTAAHAQEIINAVKNMEEINIENISDLTFLKHLGGKIEINSKIPLKTRRDLSIAYTPEVARVCMAINGDKEKAYKLTIKKNMVAVVSDGTAVLGLGDIGPEAAMPVMEGKACIFKEFASVDAFPICLNTKDTEKIIEIVKAISPGFGGINLEDISAPRCFEIEKRLIEELDIPVFHDDQHGTAVVVLAGLINALKIVKKQMSDIKVVVAGVGASGIAVSKILLNAGVINIIGVDRSGAIYRGRPDNMNFMKQWYADNTNPENIKGSLNEVITGADVFIGLSGPGVLTIADLKKMNTDSIVFAMANPIPEIMPEEAAEHVRIMATGRSDYPNQVNNSLCFPGLFRGALDVRASKINEEMKLAAAHAISSCISDEEISEDYIIPSMFDKRIVPAVSKAVAQAAHQTGVARKEPNDCEEIKID